MRIVIAVLSLLLSAHTVEGQSVTTTAGAINGTVTDGTKAVLPGVTVTLSGAVVMGTPSTITDQSGLYRFSALPPGDYTLKFELAGFGGVTKEGIRVSLGFIATVNIELNPAGVNESVTVSGGSPVVDLQSTNVTTHFDAERLSNLPGSRDVWAVLAQTPAVAMSRLDVGGSNALTQQPYTAYGLSSAGGVNRAEVEGIMVNEGAGGGGSDMYYTDYGSFAEIAVNAVGNTAQMPNPGVLTQLIGKSGGNKYHGNVYFDYENDSMEAHNIDDDQIAAGVQGSAVLDAREVNRLSNFRDFNADLGGFIVKDRLWWYGAYRYTVTNLRYPTLIDDVQKTWVPVYTGKVTFNLNQNHKFIGYFQTYVKNQPDYLGAIRIAGGRNTTALMTADSVWKSNSGRKIWKGEYNATLGHSLFFEARGGDMYVNWIRDSKSSSPRVEDVGNNFVSGGVYAITQIRHRRQVNGALSHSRSGPLGSHNLKVGAEIMNDNLLQPLTGFLNASNSVSVLNNGVPTQVDLYQTPTRSQNGLWSYSAYVNDTWQLGKRVTLNLGARFDHHRGYIPEQQGPAGQRFPAVDSAAEFTNFGPRAGGSVALTDDGKTVFKTNYGTYWLYPAADFATGLNPNPPTWVQTYAWSDLNGSGLWNPGEQGRLISASGGTASVTLDPNLRNVFVRQSTAYLEREVAQNFGVRGGFVWNGRRQTYGQINVNRPLSAYSVPVSIIDPGRDGRLGTSDDGGTFTAYNLSNEASARPIVNITTNLDGADSDYYTWEVTATRRESGRWALLATFAQTFSSETALAAGAAYTPNAFINTEDGRGKFRTWQGKIHATLNLNWDLRVSPIVRHQSGTPFGRTFVQSLNYGTATVRAEPTNAERTPNVTVVDVRTEKRVRFKGWGRATAFVDLYNIFNTNAEQAVAITSGTSFLRPSAITPPRIGRFGVRLDW